MRAQVALGQRPAGSRQLRRLAERLRALLPDGRFEAVPGEPGLRNVVGVAARPRPAIVVGAHYDTECHAEGLRRRQQRRGGHGAPSSSSRAALRARAAGGRRELRFVLFDGEEGAAAARTRDFYAERAARLARLRRRPRARGRAR